jgi:type IV pilus assembly protein PilM
MSVGNVLDSVNAEVASEIARTVDYFKTSGANADLNRVLVCGGVAKAKGLIQQLSDRMQVPVEIADPFAEIDTTGCEMDPDLLAELAPSAAVGVGLALRAVGDR